MRKRWSAAALIVSATLALCVAIPFASADEGSTGSYRGGKLDWLLPGMGYEEGSIVLVFEPDADLSGASKVISDLGWSVVGKVPDEGGRLCVEASYPKEIGLYAAERAARATGKVVDVDIVSFPSSQPVLTWNRVGGLDALWTAALIPRQPNGFLTKGGTVVLATSDGYWDALSLSALAGAKGAPVILTDPSELSFQARAEFARLEPSKVIVAGGKAAVSSRVESQVKECLDAEVVRVFGEDAQGTARAACENLGVRGGEAIVVSSTSYHDAMSIAPYAYSKRVPVLLAGPDGRLSAETLSFINERGFERVVVIGGSAAVSSEVESQLGSRFAERVFGPDAVDTSAEVVRWELKRGMEVSHMGIATARGWHDALSGAALCGKNNSVMALAIPEKLDAIDAALGAGAVVSGSVFGGTAAVPSSVEGYVRSRS